MGLALRVEGLRVIGAEGRPILAVDGLQLAPGESLGVRGPSGAGKSTLLYALAGLTRRAAGRVAWGETDLLALRPGARTRFRRDMMGFVFQDSLLFEELGAVANAALAASYATASRRRTIVAAAREELARLAIPAGRRWVRTFSGGERQRVALARALATGPAILLADEPTASLDRPMGAALVDDLIDRTRRDGISLVAVSHDDTLLGAMDRVVTIRNGELVPA